jgi:hypothetical protein
LNDIAAIATMIPKILFSGVLKTGLWGELAAAIIGEEVVEDVLDAIPFLGEIFAVISAAGDLATLVEAIKDTVESPWVIANQIDRVYTATVTVKKDHRNTIWPRTAHRWTLEASIDGAAAKTLTPLTDTFTEGESADRVLIVAAPYGGSTIVWSFVVVDEEGNQVGTGRPASSRTTIRTICRPR